jgi:Domain of unknown function (DUF4332)
MSIKPNMVNIATQSCAWEVQYLPGLSNEEKSRLQDCGITNTTVLLKYGKTTEKRLELASKLQINIQYVNKWLALADLARIPNVGTQYCGLLLHAGIISVTQLAMISVPRLHKQILRLQVSTMQRRDLCPPVEEIQIWCQQAQKIMNYSS